MNEQPIPLGPAPFLLGLRVQTPSGEGTFVGFVGLANSCLAVFIDDVGCFRTLSVASLRLKNMEQFKAQVEGYLNPLCYVPKPEKS